MVTLMPVSSSFRTPFPSKGVHVSQRMLEPALKHFDANFSIIYHKLSWKTSPLVRSAILGLFGNTLTGDHVYSPLRWKKLPEEVQTLLSQKRRIFSGILITFSESIQNFDHFEMKTSAS